MPLKAMVLCAGLGTRLRPLTYKRPKPLIPVLNRPILYHIFDSLSQLGVVDVIINLHHMTDFFKRYLSERPHETIIPSVSIEENILGTGGGIKRAQWFLDDTFILLNGDTVSSVEIGDALKFHRQKKALSTLVLLESQYAPRVTLTEGGQVKEILRQDRKGYYTFSGIQIIEPELMNSIEPNRFVDIMDVYRGLISSGCREIYGVFCPFRYWRDLGTIKDYIACNKELLLMGTENERDGETGRGTLVLRGDMSFIEEGVSLEEWAILGSGSKIRRGAKIVRSILWENVVVSTNVRVVDSIISDGLIVDKDTISEAI